jgi:HSP20 family protein
MNSLTNWDPFRDLWNMRSMVDRMFENALDRQSGSWQPVEWGLALDVTENEEEFTVKASVPGINPDDLEITFTDGTLTIKGETREEKDVEEAHYHIRERRFGNFSRSISLPSNLDADKIEASYDSGVLTLHLPKAEEMKPKRIEVKSGTSQRTIEGKLTDFAGKN